MDFSVSVIPLVVGALFSVILGALWYSPVLFAKPWMKEAGITAEYIEVSKGKMGKVYIFTTIMAFVTSYVIGFVIVNFGITEVINALLVGLIIWIGTNIPPIIKNWGFEDRTIKLGVINHGYDLVIYLVVAVLFVLF